MKRSRPPSVDTSTEFSHQVKKRRPGTRQKSASFSPPPFTSAQRPPPPRSPSPPPTGAPTGDNDPFASPPPSSPASDRKDPAVSKGGSTTIKELREVAPALARATVRRLRDGYTDKSGSGYPAAVVDAAGCTIGQKKPQRAKNGYIQITPLSTSVRGAAGNVKQKAAPQGAHRLVVWGWGGSEGRQELGKEGVHASHRCAEPRCITPSHLVAEPKDVNESRKDCTDLGPIVITEIGGQKYRLVPKGFNCPHQPPCILKVEEREPEAI